MGDTAPYFVGESITYVCDDNFDAGGADLTNQCEENTGNGDPALWSRMAADLADICQPGMLSQLW